MFSPSMFVFQAKFEIEQHRSIVLIFIAKLVWSMSRNIYIEDKTTTNALGNWMNKCSAQIEIFKICIESAYCVAVFGFLCVWEAHREADTCRYKVTTIRSWKITKISSSYTVANGKHESFLRSLSVSGNFVALGTVWVVQYSCACFCHSIPIVPLAWSRGVCWLALL